MRLQITSTMTMASSTTKPTAIDMAISDRLSMLKPTANITPAVPSSDSGITTLGMSVARTLRRKRKMTPTTRKMVIRRLISTSLTEARMVWVRSVRIEISKPAGIHCLSSGISA